MNKTFIITLVIFFYSKYIYIYLYNNYNNYNNNNNSISFIYNIFSPIPYYVYITFMSINKLKKNVLFVCYVYEWLIKYQ